jgi:hypothetical protein
VFSKFQNIISERDERRKGGERRREGREKQGRRKEKGGT